MVKYIFILVLLASCYSERKARDQFSKAAVAYPKIPADYCANQFPVKDSLITDTLLTTDTLYIEGRDSIITERINDTVRITVTKTLPAKIITNTVHIRDTIYQTNTAALKSCEIDKSILINLTSKQAEDINKYKGIARKRGVMFWGLLALLILYIGVRVYLKTNKSPIKI